MHMCVCMSNEISHMFFGGIINIHKIRNQMSQNGGGCSSVGRAGGLVIRINNEWITPLMSICVFFCFVSLI